MKQYILKENVLTDNELLVADKNKVFKGGYIAIIKEYCYSTSWSYSLVIKRFKSEKRLSDYLERHYPHFEY